MRRFTLCVFADNPPEENAEFDSRNWPLHITIVGNYFSVNSAELIADLAEGISRFQVFDALVGDEVYLGANNDIKVNAVKDCAALYEIHESVVGVLIKNNAEFSNPAYIGAGYRPHITVQKSGRKNMNDKVQVRRLSLVELEQDGVRHQRTVIKHFELANGEL